MPTRNIVMQRPFLARKLTDLKCNECTLEKEHAPYVTQVLLNLRLDGWVVSFNTKRIPVRNRQTTHRKRTHFLQGEPFFFLQKRSADLFWLG